MKTKSLLLLASVCFGTALCAQDLAPGINYSYNPPGSDGIIHGITVDVVNNDGNNAGAFDVSMYLYDMSSQNYWVIGTTNMPGLSGNSVNTISNWDIDINNTPGIPAGTYRLGIWVDSNDDISETDENNNTGLLAGNINYNPSSASGVANISFVESSVNCFPNPADGQTVLHCTTKENAAATIQVFDMTGK